MKFIFDHLKEDSYKVWMISEFIEKYSYHERENSIIIQKF
jgi:hypothetical protein